MGVHQGSPKQPWEENPFTADFHKNLAATEEVASVTVTIKKLSDNSDPSGTMFNGSASIVDGVQTNSKVVQNIKAGEAGEKYQLTFKAVTNAATPGKWEEEVVFMVEEE